MKGAENNKLRKKITMKPMPKIKDLKKDQRIKPTINGKKRVNT